ncbi:DUF4468 domain-containing protein [Psychroflexus aestuariivivens]|uniref:DUF4468 domain-containing protein n=1 Tax=Psychroflexus aestuariivivens TaxID=1795040 RepID=UPI000FDC0E2C|nr:DUF4468 domain-containing protein [Psychroflexus aestuariivivens]
MKSNILLVIAFLGTVFCSLAQDQSQFEYQSSGLSSFVVTDVNDKPASQLFSETKHWISEQKKTYQFEVIDEVGDKIIQLSGEAKDVIIYKNYTSNLKFNLEIAFKNNRYKFEISDLQYEYYNSYYDLPNINNPNQPELERHFENAKIDLPEFFNKLNKSLKKSMDKQSKLGGW